MFHCSKLCLVSVGCSSYLNSNSYSFIHTVYLCTKWLLFNAAFGNWELHSFGRSEFDLYKLVNQKLSFFSYLQKWWWIQACCAHNSRKSGTIMISSQVFQLYRNNCKYCVIVRLVVDGKASDKCNFVQKLSVCGETTWQEIKNKGNKLRLDLERTGVRVIAGAKAFLQL